MSGPSCKIELVDSGTMEAIEDLTLGSVRTFNPVFNKPGSLSVTVPLDSVVAYLIKKRSTGALLSIDGVPVWSGGATAISKSTSGSGTLSATFTGWREELDHRYVRFDEEASLRFTSPGTIGGEIYKTLIETVNAQEDSEGTTRPTHVGFADAQDTQVRIRSYKKGDNYGQITRELVEIEDGFDVYDDPITRMITTRDPSVFEDHLDARFYYPGNLADAQQDDDGTSVANRVNVQGSNGGVISVDDGAAIDDATVMLESWITVSDLVNTTILGALANAELVYNRYGIQTYTLTPKKYGDMPMPYRDFTLGGKIYFSVDKGALQIKDQAARVFSLNISFDQAGNMVVDKIDLEQA